MKSYSTEMHYYKNIKTKRPSVGYKTEKERAYAQWSVGVVIRQRASFGRQFDLI